MDQKCLPSWRNPARYPTSPDADAFVHASHLMGGVHQRGGRRAAHRAAHRGAVGHERSGRSILKLTSLCRCAGPQEAAFCVLRAMRHRGCYGIGGRVFEHRVTKPTQTLLRMCCTPSRNSKRHLPRRATRLTVWPRWPSRAKAGKTASALRITDLRSTDFTCSSSSAT